MDSLLCLGISLLVATLVVAFTSASLNSGDLDEIMEWGLLKVALRSIEERKQLSRIINAMKQRPSSTEGKDCLISSSTDHSQGSNSTKITHFSWQVSTSEKRGRGTT